MMTNSAGAVEQIAYKRIYILFAVQLSAIILGFAFVLLTNHAMVLILGIGYSFFLGFRVKFSALISLTLTTLTLLFTPVLFFQIFPVSSFEFGTQALIISIFLSVLTLVISAWLTFWSVRQNGVIELLSLLKLPTIIYFCIVIFIFVLQLLLNEHLAWVMRNDTVWNTVSARFVISDGGRITPDHPNAAPMTVWILALLMVAGRGEIPLTDLLSHDLSGVSQSLLLLTTFTAIFVALLALLGGTSRFKLVNFLIAAIGGSLPFTWFFLGYQASFGFINTAIALLVLLSLWSAWISRKQITIMIYPIIAVSSIVLLATWGPLVLVPAGILLSTVIEQRNTIFRNLRELVSAGLSVFAVILYFLIFSFESLKSNGSALAADGGFFDFKPQYFVIVLFILFGIGYLNSLITENSNFFGLVMMGIFGTLGVAILTFQRRFLPEIWGYYPAKMAWILSMFFILLFFVFASQILVKTIQEHFRASPTISLCLIVGLVLSCMCLSGPPSFRDVFTPISALSKSGLGNNSQLVTGISQLALPGSKNLVARFQASPDQDLFMNNWLLQMQSETDKDPVRWFSYFLNGTDNQMICNAIEAWGDDVVVQTKDLSLEEQLRSICTLQTFRVKVHE